MESLLADLRSLDAANPDAYLPDVATTLNNLGILLANLGERDAARSHYQEALETCWPLFEKHPAAFGHRVLNSLRGLVPVYEALGQTEDAERVRALINQIVGPDVDPTAGLEIEEAPSIAAG